MPRAFCIVVAGGFSLFSSVLCVWRPGRDGRGVSFCGSTKCRKLRQVRVVIVVVARCWCGMAPATVMPIEKRCGARWMSGAGRRQAGVMTPGGVRHAQRFCVVGHCVSAKSASGGAGSKRRRSSTTSFRTSSRMRWHLVMPSVSPRRRPCSGIRATGCRWPSAVMTGRLRARTAVSATGAADRRRPVGPGGGGGRKSGGRRPRPRA